MIRKSKMKKIKKIIKIKEERMIKRKKKSN
jgi:hypothetical protein